MKKHKAVLWFLGIGVSIVVIYIAVFIFLSFDALQPECERTQTITIENYKINKSLCEGWIGPRYFHHFFYENDNLINGYKHDIDSCRFDYISYSQSLYKVDLCKKIVKKENHKKLLIATSNADSIYFKNLSSNDSIKLSDSLKNNFINEWNHAPLDIGNSYSVNEEILYGKHQFQFKVYSKDKIRTFNTERFKIKEEKVNWIYTFLKEGEDRKNNKVFENFWNEAKN